MFHVFKCDNGTVIAVHVNKYGDISVYDKVNPKELKEVGTFEADGVSDFNHGMRRAIEVAMDEGA
jgi:hypothetical protein